MPALPPTTDWTDPGVTEGQFKTAQGQLRDFLAGLLGTSGTAAAALATLGAAFAGVVAKTATYTVAAGDRGKLLLCSGTWTLTLPAVASVGAGFMFAVRNTGSGTITVDGNAAEQIDGAATLALSGGDSRVIVCDGGAWHTVGAAPPAPHGVQVFTASGTFVVPDDVTQVWVTLTGGGGGGGYPSGGGAGGYAYRAARAVTPGASIAVTVGAGGAPGGYGGASSFGALVSRGGGAPGAMGATGVGQSSILGGGGYQGVAPQITGGTVAGNGIGYGAGGGGAGVGVNSLGNTVYGTPGYGAPGIVVVEW